MATIPPDLEVDMGSVYPDEAGDIKIVGSTGIQIHSCDSSGDWSVVGPSSGITYFIDSGSFHEGLGSLAITLTSDTTSAILKYVNPTTSFNLYAMRYIKGWETYSVKGSSGYVTWFFGESTYTERNSTHSIASPVWTMKSWDISGISTDLRDAVTQFAIKVESTYTSPKTFHIDDIKGDAGPSQISAFDGSTLIRLYPKIKCFTYTGSGSTSRINLGMTGTPDNVRIQDITPGAGKDEIIWYKGMTSGYSIRASGADSTHWILGTGDCFFDIGSTQSVNKLNDLYSCIVMWGDTTGSFST